MFLLDPDVIQRYTEILDIIFSYLIPLVKLYVIICVSLNGVSIIKDLAWLIHEIRCNAEFYAENNSKGDDK
jgi:hypothetical protein